MNSLSTPDPLPKSPVLNFHFLQSIYNICTLQTTILLHNYEGHT